MNATFVIWGFLIFASIVFGVLAFFENDEISKASYAIQGTVCMVGSLVVSFVFLMNGAGK